MREYGGVAGVGGMSLVGNSHRENDVEMLAKVRRGGGLYIRIYIGSLFD